ncbi:MAG: Spy/CpxP family protein refolding chaperone [Ignavibacteria bacterium]|nr:Spy/CpxP family protein refolding chaperone [Ignavibacteria bacterium]
MKNLKTLFAFSLIILPVIFLAGCNKQDEVTSPTNANFDSAQYLMIDYFDAQNAIEDATLEADLTINPTMLNYNFVSADDFKPGSGMMRGAAVGWMQKFDWNKHLGMILRKLKLTEDQKTKIDVLVKAYHESMKPLVKEFADANKAIIDAANAQRKAIAQDVKDGKITRREAEEKIKSLNERVRNAIETNPATATIKTQMCAARKTFLDGVRAELTTEQQTTWDDAVARMKSPC